jgi:hypothetical protein
MAELIADNILELEFNYIKETAAQTTEDRNKLLSFYVGLATSAGTASIAIFSLVQTQDVTFARLSFALLMFLIAVVGWIFLAMMVRLRQAWYGSMLAMNKIKDFYTHTLSTDILPALKWTSASLPKPEKLWTIHFYATSLINFISSLALTISIAAVFFELLPAIELSTMAVLVWLTSFSLLSFIYWVSLVRNY